MTDDDRSGYLPPHELRALFAQIGDRGEAGGVPHNPGPAAGASTPGLTGAALAPPPGVPSFAADDPATLGILIARMANEMFGAWPIPAPTPESLTTGHGMSAPASPGAAPQTFGSMPGALSSPGVSDAIAPQLMAMPSTAPTHLGGPTGSATPSATSPSTAPGGSSTGWGAPGEPSTNFGSSAPTSPTGLFAAPISSFPTHGLGTAWAPAGSGGAPASGSGASPGSGLPAAQGAPTGWTTALPGRPSGVGVPASNAALPGGVPAPGPILPSAPTIPFASAGEQLGNRVIGHVGFTPPIGGAGVAAPSSLPSFTAPTGEELAAIGEPAFGLPTSLVDQSSTQTYATAQSPNAGSSSNAGSSPFAPTSFDGWNPHGSHGRGARLPLVGDAALASEPIIAPAYQLPLTDGHSIDAPGYTPPSSELQGGAPTITGGDNLAASEHGIRQLGGKAFDPYQVRKDFPILEERVHGGKRLVWLDNAATTQKPRAVIDRLTRFYEHENSNVHRAAHTLAARATDAFESARETTRKFLNAQSAGEILFVRGATEGINLIANTWGVKNVGEGDEIVLTHLEHHANIVPWQMLCARVGARLRIAPVDDRGDVILENYEQLISPRTKLVAFTQVSNALGTITPAREMIEIAHRHGATVMLDGAQAVSHMPVDVQALGCDFYVFSGHKVFAPTGIGAVYGRREILETMPPWQGGGNMIADVTFDKTVYQPPPGRFEAGTGNIADAAGMGAALDYVMRIGMNVIDRYEHDLLVYATEKLVRVPGLEMIGTSAAKAGVLSFVLDGQRTEDVGAALDKHGIAVRSGHHCAQPILRRFGLESTVRASLAFYNVCEDIDALVEALLQLQAHRRAG